MSIVKEIVELHQGSVNMSSAAGIGSRVEVWLPVSGN
jgi:signal transduction histidine kinase